MTRQLAYYYRNREEVTPKMRDYRRRTGRARAEPLAPRICENRDCRQKFTPRREDQRHCNTACARKAQHIAQAAQQLAQRQRQREQRLTPDIERMRRSVGYDEVKAREMAEQAAALNEWVRSPQVRSSARIKAMPF